MWKRKKARDKERAGADASATATDVHDEPTQPAPPPMDDDATVWHGQDADAEDSGSVRPEEPNAAEPDAPHPAKSDAPTVAMDPSFERKLPEAPIVEDDMAPEAEQTDEGDETVQVGRRPPPDATAPPASTEPDAEQKEEDSAPAKDLDPTIPMGGRRV